MGGLLFTIIFAITPIAKSDVVKKAHIPIEVFAALDLNYELGHNVLGFGAIQNITAFDIQPGSAFNLKKVISKIIQQELHKKPSIVYLYCKEAKKTSVDSCVSQIINQKKTYLKFLDFLGALKELSVEPNERQEIWIDSLYTIENYVRETMAMGSGISYEITVGGNYDSVHESFVTILISTQSQKVLLIEWDAGE